MEAPPLLTRVYGGYQVALPQNDHLSHLPGKELVSTSIEFFQGGTTAVTGDYPIEVDTVGE
jgi:hypothetical protein